MSDAGPLMEITALERSFILGEEEVRALRGVTFTIERGEYVALIGPSGSGKSTMMYQLGCLDTPSRGSYRLAGYDVGTLDDDELAGLRNRFIGFVFQSFNLLARTTAVDNVALPLRYAGVGMRERRTRAREALDRVGLGHRWDHPPDRLSGGERQRVAIARAIVTKPALLLCDEPTGNLDEATAWQVLSLLAELQKEMRGILMIVTHSPAIAAEFPRQFTMRGRHLERTA